MRGIRVAIAAAGAVGAVLAAQTPAGAVTPGVGVNGCTAASPGGNVEGQCRSITQPGYYYLSVNNPSGGFVSAQVNCTQGGSISTSTFGWGYLNGGLCTVFIFAEYSSTVTMGIYH